jgi:hypothetical protein
MWNLEKNYEALCRDRDGVRKTHESAEINKNPEKIPRIAPDRSCNLPT